MPKAIPPQKSPPKTLSKALDTNPFCANAPQITRRRLMLGAGALGGLAWLHPFAAQARPGQAHLRILATTDLHCHIQPYDYYADKPAETLGLARTASIMAALRAESGNTLTLDNGDYLQGNPMGDFIAYRRGMAQGQIHPVIAGMNAVGYDAGTLGNHEFNYGVDFLDAVNAGATFPLVCANFAHALAEDPLQDHLHLPPYVILRRSLRDGAGQEAPLRIGIIGFVPPQIMQWDRAHLAGKYQVRDILQAARAHVPKMRAEGADIVIALAHSGLDFGPESPGMEDASYHLAGVAGIDAVVMGHAHGLWPSDGYQGAGMDAASGKIQGKPAVMAGFWGSHLGVIDLLLERAVGGPGWRVLAGESALRPISERGEDRVVRALVGDYAPALAATAEAHQATLDYVRAEVGRTSAPLHSYFALVADDPSVQIVSLAQAWYVRQLLAGSAHEGLPILSAAAPFKAGGRGGPDYYTDVPAGPVAIKNVADLYLYPNTLQVVRITGAQLRGWLERSAGAFLRITPGQADQPLLDGAFRSYNFDVIDGVRYAIDITQPSRFDADGGLVDGAAQRIIDLKYDGQDVEDDQEFIVATNNYRASGGGRFPGADGSSVIVQAPDTNRDIIVRYLHEMGEIAPAADGNWRFAPAGGATVLFDTGPKALAYLDAIRARGIAIAPAGEGEGGFSRFRITL